MRLTGTKRPRTAQIAALGGSLLLSAVAAPRAHACCDDALSCAAAFFSGGVTCAVEEAARTIAGFVASVEALIGAMQSQIATEKAAMAGEADFKMTQTALEAESMRYEASLAWDQAVESADAAAEYLSVAHLAPGIVADPSNEAARLAEELPLRVTFPRDETGDPLELEHVPHGLTSELLASSATLAHVAAFIREAAEPEREREAIDAAREQMHQLKEQIHDHHTNAIAGHAVVLRRDLDERLLALDAALAVAVVAPLATLLATMPPDPVIGTAAIAAMLLTLEQVRNDFAAQVVPVAHAAAARLKDDLDGLQNKTRAMREDTEKAKVLAGLMERLSRSHSLVDLERLEAALGFATSHTVPDFAFLELLRSCLQQPAEDQTVGIAAIWRAFDGGVSKVAGLSYKQPVSEQTFANALKQQFDKALLGKTPAEARAQKQAMTDKARKKYGKYPQTLAGVLAVVERESARRGVM